MFRLLQPPRMGRATFLQVMSIVVCRTVPEAAPEQQTLPLQYASAGQQEQVLSPCRHAAHLCRHAGSKRCLCCSYSRRAVPFTIAGQRERMLKSTEKMDKTTDRIAQGRQQLAETEVRCRID